MRSHCFGRGAAGRQAAGQVRQAKETGWHQLRLGHHTKGYTAIPRDRRVLSKQGILSLGCGGITGGTSSRVGDIRYGPQVSEGFCRIQGSVRLHQVLRHWPHDTCLSHKARPKVLGHQFSPGAPGPEASLFPQCPVCSLANKSFFPGCCHQAKQGEIQLPGFFLSQCSCSPVVHTQPVPREPKGRACTAQLCPTLQEHPALLEGKGGSLLRLQWCKFRGQRGWKSRHAS